jgi:hypothetical protein
MRQQDLSMASSRAELIDKGRDAVLDQVVSEEHHEGIGAEVGLGDLDRVRQTERGLLRNISDLAFPAGAVAAGTAYLSLRVSDDDPNLIDAGGLYRLDRIEQDRLVGHGHELLRARMGDRSKPRSPAAAQNQGFHNASALIMPIPLYASRGGLAR